MRRFLVVFAVIVAVLNVGAEVLDQRAAVYLLKPLATLALVAIVLRTSGIRRYRTMIAAGLTASLAGDILLMLPQGLFVPGLVAFLVAHACYIVAFAGDGGGVRAPRMPVVPVALLAAGVLAYLWPSLGAMRVPVVCYVAVISTMAWQGIGRWMVRRTPHAALAAAGSVFFLASDASLAIRKFAVPFAGATFVIMTTYYIAQWGIALSVRDGKPPAS